MAHQRQLVDALLHRHLASDHANTSSTYARAIRAALMSLISEALA